MLYLDYNTGLNKFYGLHNVALDAGLIEEFSASKYPELVEKMPKDGNGQKTRKTCYVIIDKKKDPKDWIVCLASKVDRKEYIGTILEEINEYVKKEYKFRPPSLGSAEDNEAPEVEDSDIDEAIEDLNLADAAKAESLRKGVNGED